MGHLLLLPGVRAEKPRKEEAKLQLAAGRSYLDALCRNRTRPRALRKFLSEMKFPRAGSKFESGCISLKPRYPSHAHARRVRWLSHRFTSSRLLLKRSCETAATHPQLMTSAEKRTSETERLPICHMLVKSHEIRRSFESKRFRKVF